MSADHQTRTSVPGIVAQQKDIADGHILYDSSACSMPASEYFEPDHWRARNAVISESEGRAQVLIFRDQNRERVLRHYHRGGWVSRLSRDRYWWTGLDQTRAWREWRLLAVLYELGLPAPRPVAARVMRHGLLYSADLVTDYLAGTRPLADYLMRGALSDEAWRRIGTVIRQFHEMGVFHADLNARNILIDAEGGVYLIDFDKGYRGKIAPHMRHENLERLQRSLHKFNSSRQPFHFSAGAWRELLTGYQSGG
jgi:3-deoxy-D-manno-octulosonic acid kinase